MRLGYTLKIGIDLNNWDILLLKVDNLGNLIWLKTFGGNENEESGQNIIVSSEREIIFTGRTYSYGMGNDDAYFIKVPEFK